MEKTDARLAEIMDRILGPCSCIEGYKSRGLTDPQCHRCESEDDLKEYIASKERELAALREDVARLRKAITKAADAIERVELSVAGWEDDEDIVCLNHAPIGGTIGRRGGPDFARWWPETRKILAQKVRAAVDAAKEAEHE